MDFPGSSALTPGESVRTIQSGSLRVGFHPEGNDDGPVRGALKPDVGHFELADTGYLREKSLFLAADCLAAHVGRTVKAVEGLGVKGHMLRKIAFVQGFGPAANEHPHWLDR